MRALIAVVILLVTSLGARQWLHRSMDSIAGYEAPAMAHIDPTDGTMPVAQNAVLVIIDGLRDDISREMPALESLRRQGAQAQVRASWPATPQTAWTTILSGAWPELHGALVLDSSNKEQSPITVDHLLRRARVTRHTTVLAGHKRWESMIPAGGLTKAVFSTGMTIEDDAQLIEQAVDILATMQPDLMVVQLSQLETASHADGGTSDKYYRMAQRIDEQLRRLISTVDWENTVLAITSDYRGPNPFEEDNPAARTGTAPLIIAGRGVKAGNYAAIDQTDIAPTLSALLGLPIPAQSQGTVRFEMLDIDAPLRAEKAMTLAQQQIRLSNAYLATIAQTDAVQYENGEAGRGPTQTLDVARSAWDISNVQGAFEIARQSEQTARQAMAAGRAAKMADERQARLPVLLGAGALFLIGLLWTLSLRTAWLFGAGLLAWLGPLGNAGALATILDLPAMRWSPTLVGTVLGVAAAIWTWQSKYRGRWLIAAAALGAGLLFAITQPDISTASSTVDIEDLRSAVVWRSLIALLVGEAAVLTLVWSGEQEWRAVARTSYRFAYVLIAGLLVELAAGYWLHGLAITWYLPDANRLLWHLMGLMQTMLVAGLGTLLPVVVIPAVLILHRLRRQPVVDPGMKAPEVERIRP